MTKRGREVEDPSSTNDQDSQRDKQTKIPRLDQDDIKEKAKNEENGNSSHNDDQQKKETEKIEEKVEENKEEQKEEKIEEAKEETKEKEKKEETKEKEEKKEEIKEKEEEKKDNIQESSTEQTTTENKDDQKKSEETKEVSEKTSGSEETKSQKEKEGGEEEKEKKEDKDKESEKSSSTEPTKPSFFSFSTPFKFTGVWGVDIQKPQGLSFDNPFVPKSTSLVEESSTQTVAPVANKENLVTGEEDEDRVFQTKGSLYAWDVKEKQWKERGTGQLRLNACKTDEGRSRLVMRQDQCFKLILNTAIFPSMTCDKVNEKNLTFTGVSEGEKLQCYLIKGKPDDISELEEKIKKYKALAEKKESK